MSYWVSLQDENGIVSVDRFSEGGTLAVGGSDEADLNVTYNYGKHYSVVFPENGLRWLHGKKSSDTLEVLDQAVQKLGTTQSDDYWEPTEGNAGFALSILLAWGRQYPDARWNVN